MLHRLGLVAGWAAATAAVVALGWAAVGAVTGPVTAPQPLPAPPPTIPDVEPEPSPSAAGRSAETTELVGGDVAVRNDEGTVELLFATPREGFAVDVRAAGPARIDVRFTSPEHESRFRVEAGEAERVEERPS